MSEAAKGELAAAESKLAAAKGKLAAAKGELAAAESKLAAAKGELVATKTAEEKKRAQDYYDVLFAGFKTAQSAVDATQALVNSLLLPPIPTTGRTLEEQGGYENAIAAALAPFPFKVVNDDNTCEFILENPDGSRRKVAKLLVDSGSQKDLILPAYDAIRLGLKELPNTEHLVEGATGLSKPMVQFEQALVTFQVFSKGKVVHEKTAGLSVYVWKEFIASARARAETQLVPAATPPKKIVRLDGSSGDSDARGSSDFTTPARKSSRSNDSNTCSGGSSSNFSIKLSPFKHRTDPEQAAILGAPGLKKLRLLHNHEKDRIYPVHGVDVVLPLGT